MPKRKAEPVEPVESAEPAEGAEPETETTVTTTNPAQQYLEKVRHVNAIASPLAPRKLTKKLLKAVKKAAKEKHLKRGVKEVVKALRKGEKGLVIIAGDISPIDVITHIPVLCEDAEAPYCYVPSKEDLGQASSTKRPTSCVMVSAKGSDEDAAAVAELSAEILTLPAPQ